MDPNGRKQESKDRSKEAPLTEDDDSTESSQLDSGTIKNLHSFSGLLLKAG